MKRVGLAKAPSSDRVLHYGVHRTEHGTLLARFEGYEKDGWVVGLPSAGPGSAHLQPLFEFAPTMYQSVVFFEGESASAAGK